MKDFPWPCCIFIVNESEVLCIFPFEHAVGSVVMFTKCKERSRTNGRTILSSMTSKRRTGHCRCDRINCFLELHSSLDVYPGTHQVRTTKHLYGSLSVVEWCSSPLHTTAPLRRSNAYTLCRQFGNYRKTRLERKHSSWR